MIFKGKNAKRREFILGLGGLALTATAGSILIGHDALSKSFDDNNLNASRNKKKVFHTNLSIIQGLTSETQTQIAIDVPIGMKLHYQMMAQSNASVVMPTVLGVTEFSSQPWSVHQLLFSGLQLGEIYSFQVFDSEMKMIDERIVRTLDLSNKNPKIGIVSCLRDSVENETMWDGVYSAKPDVLLFLGDNVYVSTMGSNNADKILRRYLEARQTISFYHRKELIPTVATWDDHDYGDSNGLGDFRYKEESKKFFHTFFPQAALDGFSLEQGPGVASSLKAFGQQFLLLDVRWFRSDDKNKSGSVLGAEQQQWILNKLKEFEGVSWLMAGTQFFGSFGMGEGYEVNFKSDLYSFLDGVKATGRKVLFSSGDVHHSEILDIEADFLGYKTLELTSSGLHSATYPFTNGDDRRLKNCRDKNFLLVQTTQHDDRMDMSIDAVGTAGKKYFNQLFTLDL